MESAYTVIIPAYNAAGTIAETIESTLKQTVPPERIIVIDDGSTDDTRAVAERFGERVTILSQLNQGPGPAMSLGMRFCKTPLIAGVDADDVWLPEKIERQLEILNRNPTCMGVFTKMQHFGATVTTEIINDGWVRSTMLIRREMYETLGGVIDPPGRRGDMVDWLARAREAGFAMQLLPEVLVMRRVSMNSLSAGRDLEKDRGYVHVAVAALRRKRARLAEASEA